MVSTAVAGEETERGRYIRFDLLRHGVCCGAGGLEVAAAFLSGSAGG